MLHRRTLIATAAACALSASVAGAATAMPDGLGGPALSAEVELFQQSAASPEPSSAAGISALEVSLFHARAYRFVAERSPGDEALDREYEAASYVRLAAETTAPQWFGALMVRSHGLNRMFRLGAYAELAD